MKFKTPKLRTAETETEAFLRHMNEVRIVMTAKTKTELIQIIGALLVDNKGLKTALEARKPVSKLKKLMKRMLPRV